MDVTIMLIDGDWEIHAAGCADIRRRRALDNHNGRWNSTVQTTTDLAYEIASDFIDEHSMSEDEAVGWVESGMKPCCHDVPSLAVAR